MTAWLSYLARTASFWRSSALRAYGPLVALVLLYYLAARATIDSVGQPLAFDAVDVVSRFRSVIILTVFFTPFFGFAWLVATDTGERPFLRLVRWVRRTPWIEITLLRMLPMLVLFGVFQKTFVAVKKSIPEFVPFQWDPVFITMDRILFLGTDPWVISHALLDSALATRVIDVFYGVWMLAMLFGYAIAAAMPLASVTRMTFTIAFFLNWAIVGSLLATIFSSVGPVYMEPQFGDTTFAPLMERLARQDAVWGLSALNLQDLLWQGYVDPEKPFYGISAFPSLHLGIATTITLFGFACNRWIGRGLVLFTAIIMIGSVHLGWHYAVDGIAGILLALVIWKGSQAFAEWWLGKAPNAAIAGARAAVQCPLEDVSPEKS